MDAVVSRFPVPATRTEKSKLSTEQPCAPRRAGRYEKQEWVLVAEEDMGKLPELQVQLFLAVPRGAAAHSEGAAPGLIRVSTI